MSLMGKATMEGLESVAKEVLAPHFHQANVTPKKVRFFFFFCISIIAQARADVSTKLTLIQFAVRTNMRNHNTLKRDAIIKMVAGLVGQPHKVDLKNYDLLITVEIYQVGTIIETKRVESLERKADIGMQNICGVSVVDHRFEELKRYNIAPADGGCQRVSARPRRAISEHSRIYSRCCYQ